MLLKNQILSFCRKADRDRKHLYSHSLSTNGSIYDERFFREMEQYGLTNVNASMVGLGDIHNKLRPSQDYDAETVVKNLLKMTRHTTVVININSICQSVLIFRELQAMTIYPARRKSWILIPT